MRMKQIRGFEKYYVCDSGDIYKRINKNHPERKQWKKLKLFVSPYNGYVYTNLSNNKKRWYIRVHIIIALYFVPNPQNKPIVGHKDNIKHHNNYRNLEWTTVSENTKKAFDECLAHNDKGFDDSQSIHVEMEDGSGNITRFGSITIASKATGIHMSNISRSIKSGKRRKDGLLFRKTDIIYIDCGV